jgi:3-deoxy-D-manno-octulosonic-acid transferase
MTLTTQGLKTPKASFLDSLWNLVSFGLYQIALVLVGTAYLLGRWLKGRGLPLCLRERLAWYTEPKRQAMRRLRSPIWIHLVSVGEAMAAYPLVEELRRRFPACDWIFTTTTPTGRSVAERLIRPDRDILLYLPWDLIPVVRRAVHHLTPALFLCFETELWPALFMELACQGIPIAVVNGRISPSAYRRYLWVRPFMERFLRPVDIFLVQSPQDARRYAAIGAAKDRLLITGNVKWDLDIGSLPDKIRSDEIRRRFNIAPQAVLWTAGSTHPGEERILLRAYGILKREFPHLRLLIAPRHPDRAGEVEAEVRRAGWKARLRSELDRMAPSGSLPIDVGGSDVDPIWILDTVGELRQFYGVSDLVFVGGSLIPHGGHNLVEPAMCQKAILAGPHLFNFSDVAEQLVQAGALMVVRSDEEMAKAVRSIVRTPGLAQTMGRRAYGVVEAHRGAAARTADWIAVRWGKRLG